MKLKSGIAFLAAIGLLSACFSSDGAVCAFPSQITAAEAKARYFCKTEADEPGIFYAAHCWPLTTKSVNWEVKSSWSIDPNIAPLAALEDLEEVFLGYPIPGYDSVLSHPKNEVCDLSALSKLTKLRQVDLAFSDVADLAPLSALTALEYLDIRRIPVDEISVIADLPNLMELHISKVMSPLTEMAQVKRLGLTGYELTDISSLSALDGLRYLELHGSELRDLSPLDSMIELRELHLKGTSVVDLSPLAGLTNLEVLTVRSKELDDLSPLASLRKLRKLDINGTRVRDLSQLPNASTLDIRWHGPLE